MGNNNAKYGGNKNLWQKVYTQVRRPPQEVSITIPNTFVTYSLDLQRVIRHRDMYKIIEHLSNSIAFYYDEGLIYFDHESEKSKDFNFTFPIVPYVVFTIDEVASASNPLLEGTHNVQLFGVSKTTTGSCAGVSAEISGVIRYRAVAATSYPCSVSSSYSGSIFCYAGTDAFSGETTGTASYPFLMPAATVPDVFYFTAFDNGYYEADTFISATIDVTEATLNASAEMNANVNFIADDL